MNAVNGSESKKLHVGCCVLLSSAQGLVEGTYWIHCVFFPMLKLVNSKLN